MKLLHPLMKNCDGTNNQHWTKATLPVEKILSSIFYYEGTANQAGMNKGDFINLLKEQDTALEYNCTCLGFREINETKLPLVTL